jgi:hypothetical protein
MEDRSLLVVVEKRAPTIMKYADLVPTQAGRGARMEEPGVVLTGLPGVCRNAVARGVAPSVR